MKQIRLPAHLHRQAKEYAKRTRMKLEGVIELAVANGLKVMMDRDKIQAGQEATR